MKIWVKTYTEDKITNNIVYKIEEKYTPIHFEKYMQDIAEMLNISTPLILKKHIKHLNEFGSVKFLPDEFVDYVDFDFLLIELIDV